MDDIVFKKKYIDLDSIQSIKKFFDVTINDKLDTELKNFVPGKGMCWDRPLRFEIKKNPIHNIVDKLKNWNSNIKLVLVMILARVCLA